MALRPRELCNDCEYAAPLGSMRGLWFCNAMDRPVGQNPSHCLYYRGQRRPIDVVIITAVDIEWSTVLTELHPDGSEAWTPWTTVSDGLWRMCEYKSSKDPRATIRLALTKTRTMGLSSAASFASLGIQLFRPSYVVMLGITAGRKDKTAIGDIVVPIEVWDYGAGKWEEESGKLVFKSRAERQQLEEHVRQYCSDLGTRVASLRRIRDDWSERERDSAKFATPVVHIAPMVSGAAVVNTESIWQRVLEQNDKVVAIDMEAYAVALATHLASIPHYHPTCLVAKSVCDFGVEKKKDAQQYAAYTSVQFFKLYLEEVILGVEYTRTPARSNVPIAE